MAYQPYVNEIITIDDATYRFAEHPSAPGMPYGQQGQQSVVYRLLSDQPEWNSQALKIFHPRYRTPSLVTLTKQTLTLALLPGLEVCQRLILSPKIYRNLCRKHPDLSYAVVMPWIDGITWHTMIQEKRSLTRKESLGLAQKFVSTLVTMEEQGIAHCDLSASNMLMNLVDDFPQISLIDVEGLYAPDLTPPTIIPGGSPGYMHRSALNGMWASSADRFAGAILLIEMLGWYDPVIREAAWGESVFSPLELQLESARFHKIEARVQELWGDAITRLFREAWRSENLSDCPTMKAWEAALSGFDREHTEPHPAVESAIPITESESVEENLCTDIMIKAEQASAQGDHTSAITYLKDARQHCPAGMLAYLEARIETLSQIVVEDVPTLPEDHSGWQCGKCGSIVPEYQASCPQCGQDKHPEIPQIPEMPQKNESMLPRTSWECPECGSAVSYLQNVCAQCGYQRGAPTVSQDLTRNKTRLPVWAWVGIVLVVIVLCATVSYVFGRLSSAQPTPEPPPSTHTPTLTPSPTETSTVTLTPTTSATPTPTLTPTLVVFQVPTGIYLFTDREDDVCARINIEDIVFVTQCIDYVIVQQNGKMEFHISWAAGLDSPDVSAITKYSDEGNTGMYLQDDLGNRYDHIELQEAAGNDTLLRDGDMVYGVFLFDKAVEDATQFTFYDDNQELTMGPVSLEKPDARSGEPSPRATPTPRPTKTPTPTLTPTQPPPPTTAPPEPTTAPVCAAPVPLYPPDGSVYDTWEEPEFGWSYKCVLAQNQHFDVRVWREGNPHWGVNWTKDPRFWFDAGAWYDDYGDGRFCWSIAIVQGQNGVLEEVIVDEGPSRCVDVRLGSNPKP